MSATTGTRPGRRWWYLLFAVQWGALLWPPIYNHISPRWLGVPFFYWYQLSWVIIGAVLTSIVYFATESSRTDSEL
jgi:hypothetical protein